MIEAALGIVRREDGRILCVFNRRFRTFGLPGGKLAEGEEPFDACCRELFEETGWVTYGWKRRTVEDGPVGDVERVYVYELEACERKGDNKNAEDTSFAWLKPDELIDVSKFGERLRKVFAELGIS